MAWLFSRAANQESVDQKCAEDDDLQLDLEDEEQEFQPPCSLQICTNLSTGEEDETEICVHRAKMFRFHAAKWKERGIGDARLLKNSETGRVRFLMRQERTFKVIGNHYVTNQSPYCDLQPLSESNLFWVWKARNAIDDTVVDETIALKFDTVEQAETFAQMFSSSKGPSAVNEETLTSAPNPDEPDLVEEEEVLTVDGWAPSMTLEIQEMQTGEEQEELLYRQRSKLFRFRDGEWRERGKGDASLLRNSVTGAVRFLMREEKTRKVVANHAVAKMPPYCDIRPGIGSDRTWVWLAQNYAEYAEDGEPSVEQLALKLGSTEHAQQFAAAWASVLEQDARADVDTASASSPKRPLGISDGRSSPESVRKASRLALEDRKPSSSATHIDQLEEEQDTLCASPVRGLGGVKDPIPMRSRTMSELDRSEQFFAALGHPAEPFQAVEQHEKVEHHSAKQETADRPQMNESHDVRSTEEPEKKFPIQHKSQMSSIKEEVRKPIIRQVNKGNHFKKETQTASLPSHASTFDQQIEQTDSFKKENRFASVSSHSSKFDQDERPSPSVKDLVAKFNRGSAVQTAVSQIQNSHRQWRERASSLGRSVRSTEAASADAATSHDTKAIAKRPRDKDVEGTASKRLRTEAQEAVATTATPQASQQQLELPDKIIMERLGNVAGRLERFAGLGLNPSEFSAIAKAQYVDLKKLLSVADRIEAATNRLLT